MPIPNVGGNRAPKEPDISTGENYLTIIGTRTVENPIVNP
jgi:hypothetical protein